MTPTMSYSGCNGSPSAQAESQLSFPPLSLVSSFSYFQTADTQIIDFFHMQYYLSHSLFHSLFPSPVQTQSGTITTCFVTY